MMMTACCSILMICGGWFDEHYTRVLVAAAAGWVLWARGWCFPIELLLC